MQLKTISATSYNLYKECPNCWKLKYKVGLIQPDSDALIIGKGFHKGAELFHKGVKESDIFDSIKKDILVNKEKDTINTYSIVRKMVELYLKNPLNGKTIGTEKMFRTKIPNVPAPLFGFIDRETEDSIIDYKSTSVDYTEKELENFQFDIYSYVKYKETGIIPNITLYVINKNKINKKDYKPQILTTKRTMEDMDKLEEKCYEFYNNILNENFSPTPKNHSFWSYYKKYCK